MSSSTSQVSRQDSAGVSAAAQQRGRGTDAALRAPVDIHETSDGLVLAADMPGVSKDRLEVRVDGNTLLIEGQVQFDLPEGSEAVYADVRASAYRRSFELSRELDSSKIQANLKDGVLTVRIPKQAALQPRRIEVR